MSVYKDKKTKDGWLVRLYRNGKPKSWTVHGTRKEADRFESRKRLELAAAPAQGEHRTAPGFADFCVGRYRVHAETHLGHATWDRTRRYQVAILGEHFGNKRLDRFTAADVEQFQRARRKEVSAATVNGDVVILRSILRYAIEQGIPAVLPKAKSLKVAATKGRVQVWSEPQVQALYRALERLYPWLLGPVVILMNTGMRKGEALALEWAWVDLDRQMLNIQPNAYWRPKNNQPREVPIGATALPWLSTPVDKRPHPKWVFPTQRRNASGEGRYKEWPRDQFNAARDLADVGGSPHVCRHTFASHFLAAVPDMFLLAQVLGHSHVRITKIYSHLLPGHLARARDAVMLAPPLMLTGEVAARVGRCRAGHAMTEDNTYLVPKTGRKRCRTCVRERERRSRNRGG